jgi:translation initiation factor 1
MAEVCPTCGLPKDLCVCGEIEKEQQRIRIRLETRKFGRPTTIIDGIDDKNSTLHDVSHKLKSHFSKSSPTLDAQYQTVLFTFIRAFGRYLEKLFIY